jgi:hypothetical protein
MQYMVGKRASMEHDTDCNPEAQLKEKLIEISQGEDNQN